jgi:hypothetical protein
MRKTVSLLIIFVLIISGVNATALIQKEKNEKIELLEGKQESWKFSIKSSYPEFTDKDQYIKVEIKEANQYTKNPDDPMLPFYSIVKTFPLGTKIINVRCDYENPRIIPISKELSPPPQMKVVGNSIFGINNDIKIKSEFFKSEINDCFAYKTGGGLKDGKHVTILSIHYFPLKYKTEDQCLEFINRAEIEVLYEEPAEKLLDRNEYSLLILSPSSFLTQLQSLAEHKTSFGISTKIVTLEEIYNGNYFPVEGNDDQEKIKYFIKNALEQWGNKYLLLVGDIYKLPIRKTWIGERLVPTDLYYADVFFSDGSFASWDSNGNGRYGEYWQQSDDIVDLYADVNIGRLACKNPNEVRTVVKKIIKYEESASAENWFNNLILCGGDTHPHWGVYEGEVVCDEIEKVLPEFSSKKLYTSKGTFSASAVNRELRNGAGFFAYCGHGFEISIATHAPNNDDWIHYDILSILGLFNFEKLPVIFFDACLTGGLDYTLGKLLKLPFINIPMACIAWRFVNKITGGAIATIGASRVAFSMVDDEGPHAGSGYLSLHFYKNYEDGITVSEMLVASQFNYLTHIWEDPMTLEEFILFGDPSLMVGGYDV